MKIIIFITILITTTTSSILHPYNALKLNIQLEDEFCIYHEPLKNQKIHRGDPMNSKKNKENDKNHKIVKNVKNHRGDPMNSKKNEENDKNRKNSENSENVKCGLCIMSILQQDQKCHPLKTPIPNCLFYESEKTCKSCQYNYKLNNTRTSCERIQIKNCYQQEDQNCIACKNSILPENGRCTNLQNFCTIKNCSICGKRQNIEFCYKCEKNFSIFLKNKNSEKIFCLRENENTKNCNLLRPGNDQQCAVCDVNFFLNRKGVCVKSSKYYTDLIGFGEVVMKVFMVWVFLA